MDIFILFKDLAKILFLSSKGIIIHQESNRTPFTGQPNVTRPALTRCMKEMITGLVGGNCALEL